MLVAFYGIGGGVPQQLKDFAKERGLTFKQAKYLLFKAKRTLKGILEPPADPAPL